MAYCTPADVDLGSLELPRDVDLQKVINRTANDIDSVIGRIYRLPLQLSDQDPGQRPYKLFLLKLNVYLTTGDVIIKAAGARQDDGMNASGMWYLRQANDAIKRIEAGKIRFPGQTLIPVEADVFSGPYAQARDSSSRVEDFYDDTPGALPPQYVDQEPVTTWPQ